MVETSKLQEHCGCSMLIRWYPETISSVLVTENRVRWVLAFGPGIRYFSTVHFASKNIITLYHELYFNIYEIQALA